MKLFFQQKKERQIKKWHWLAILIILVVALGVKVYYSHWPTTVISINGRPFTVLVASTIDHLVKGLGGRDNLDGKDGLLLVFTYRGKYSIVMRDMRFPLDIIWIDGNTIVDIAPNVQPEPGRAENELTQYRGRAPATHVLEVPAGFVRENGIKIGDQVSF